MDEPHPGLGHRFMVTPVDGVRYLVLSIQSLDAGADFIDCFGERMAKQIQISDFDVIAVMPFL